MTANKIKTHLSRLILFLGMTVPVLVWGAVEMDCAGGRVVIPGDNSAVVITGSCEEVGVMGDGNTVSTANIGTLEEVNVMGNGNTVSAANIETLTLGGSDNTVHADLVFDISAGGDRNTIHYRKNNNGNEPRTWFGGAGNQLVPGGGNTTNSGSSGQPDTSRPAAVIAPAPEPAADAGPQMSHSAGDGKLPPLFHNMWFIYKMSNGAKWTAMTFTDGTLTTDVNKVMESGVAASKREKPDRWAAYTTTEKGEQLVARFPGWSKPRKYFITDRSIKMSSSFKLTGCFSSQSSSIMGMAGVAGTSTYSSNEFCFDRNGRFSTDSSIAISGSVPTSLGTSLRGSQGTYQINGNLLTLTYTDGQSFQYAFGAYRFGEKNLTAISIGQRLYLS